MGIPKQQRRRVISGVMQMTIFLFLNSYKKCVLVSIWKHNQHIKPVIPWLLSRDESKIDNRKPQVHTNTGKMRKSKSHDSGAQWHWRHDSCVAPVSSKASRGMLGRVGWRLSNENTMWMKELNGVGERGLSWRTDISVQFALHISQHLSNLRIYS